VKVWIELSWLGMVPVADSFEHCKILSGSIKGGEILDQLSDFTFCKFSAAWSFCLSNDAVSLTVFIPVDDTDDNEQY
jgi:hypothetical protein